MESGKLWLSGGTISDEGKWGMIAVFDNINWERYRLNGYYFSDVEFLNDNEVIAVGSEVASNNFGGANDSNKGVILFSSNSGKEFYSLYESKINTQFNSIAKISKDKLVVLGNKGEIISLERK